MHRHSRAAGFGLQPAVQLYRLVGSLRWRVIMEIVHKMMLACSALVGLLQTLWCVPSAILGSDNTYRVHHWA